MTTAVRDLAFLAAIDPELMALALEAVRDEASHPRAAVISTRLIADELAQWIGKRARIARGRYESPHDYLQRLKDAGEIPTKISDTFHIIREGGNLGAHAKTTILASTASRALNSLEAIGRWIEATKFTGLAPTGVTRPREDGLDAGLSPPSPSVVRSPLSGSQGPTSTSSFAPRRRRQSRLSGSMIAWTFGVMTVVGVSIYFQYDVLPRLRSQRPVGSSASTRPTPDGNVGSNVASQPVDEASAAALIGSNIAESDEGLGSERRSEESTDQDVPPRPVASSILVGPPSHHTIDRTQYGCNEANFDCDLPARLAPEDRDNPGHPDLMWRMVSCDGVTWEANCKWQNLR